ncbi:electron transfer flavoprotein subunit beta/FixA family protein [Vibrio viridaestus]|uniref:Electron transfer flavoprotein subunit beta n=1 Tax=Vibrio viridaestus TaxID=2487322 RepID=A0A3N9TIF8_9VIBR|nr:electron transfer flavoprotein subunit beta/FixA family protein [Vibrio viridaestus]RQW63325.1 electron transfer flavoprotein subunit beta/FixA family protein [Vibrio viridaestus]
MKILVAVKRVVDYNIKVRVKDDNSAVETDGVKMSMNPFCEIAVEQAVKLKEQGQVDEIVVVSIGETKAQDQIRHALAMGADRGILVESQRLLEPLHVAQILNGVVSEEQPDLILMGKQSIDGDNAQSAAMLSGLLDYPISHCASAIEFNEGCVRVRYEVDNGEEVAELGLPAIITADLRLAEPRFVKLPNVMKAKKKPLDVKTLDQLNIDVVSHQTRVLLETPPGREGNGVICASAGEFIGKILAKMGE